MIDEREQNGLSLEEIGILQKIYDSEQAKKICHESDILKICFDLETKGLIKVFTNQDKTLSFFLREKGKLLVKEQNKPVKKDIPASTTTTTNTDKFEEFWTTFPISDEHGIYRRSRVLKSAKELCKKKYIFFLETGTKHEDVIKALKYEINLRKDSNNKTNSMTYMKNSLTWLNQREWEIILETMSEDNKSTSNDDWTSNSI